MPSLQLKDVSLHYEIEGKGPAMLLIAGVASDSASWGPLVPLLQDHFTLIMPDNRSTGRTTPWDAVTDPGQNALDCAALLRHLGVGKAHVVGHSMGGMVALELAGAAPDTVATVTLMASAPHHSLRNMALFNTLLDVRETPGARPDLWLMAFYPWLFKPSVFAQPDALRHAAGLALSYPYLQSASAMRHQLAGLSGYDFAAMKRDLDLPIQALIAEHDLLMPQSEMRRILPEFGDVAFHLVKDAGHSLHWDQPEAVADLILRFALGGN